MKRADPGRPRVVIIGGGFGGLFAARELGGAPVRVTVIDRTNHHLFQPLLYQVAMAGLSPAEIAQPIRSLLAHQENVTVLLAEAVRIDTTHKVVELRDETLAYDYLIVATGAETSYFGHDEWARYAPGLKGLDDAVEIRQRVLLAFEEAEKEEHEPRRKQLLTFVVIGGGPTGVELAGAIAELAKTVLATDFRSINPKSAKVILLEAGPKILSTFTDDLQARALEQLEELGVVVRTGARVTGIDATGVYLGDEQIACSVVLWGAGVRATPLVQSIGAPLDRMGRVKVEPDCSVPGHPEVFVVGDAACLDGKDGKPLPGVSQTAMQQARHAARIIREEVKHGTAKRTPFEYWDKGSMATIGRSRAIAQIGRMHISGFLAWLAWLLVHVWFLIGFRNRIVVMITWAWSYFTYHRGARLITGLAFHEFPKAVQPAEAVVPSRRLGDSARIPAAASTSPAKEASP
jgi:NADH dehydrogenase